MKVCPFLFPACKFPFPEMQELLRFKGYRDLRYRQTDKDPVAFIYLSKCMYVSRLIKSITSNLLTIMKYFNNLG